MHICRFGGAKNLSASTLQDFTSLCYYRFTQRGEEITIDTNEKANDKTFCKAAEHQSQIITTASSSMCCSQRIKSFLIIGDSQKI